MKKRIVLVCKQQLVPVGVSNGVEDFDFRHRVKGKGQSAERRGQSAEGKASSAWGIAQGAEGKAQSAWRQFGNDRDSVILSATSFI